MEKKKGAHTHPQRGVVGVVGVVSWGDNSECRELHDIPWDNAVWHGNFLG